jgi:hypothetical protein
LLDDEIRRALWSSTRKRLLQQRVLCRRITEAGALSGEGLHYRLRDVAGLKPILVAGVDDRAHALIEGLAVIRRTIASDRAFRLVPDRRVDRRRRDDHDSDAV